MLVSAFTSAGQGAPRKKALERSPARDHKDVFCRYELKHVPYRQELDAPIGSAEMLNNEEPPVLLDIIEHLGCAGLTGTCNKLVNQFLSIQVR